MVAIGGHYIIYAGGSLTKVSGIYFVTVFMDSRPNFEIDQNQDNWARDLLLTSFVGHSLLPPPRSQYWEGCIHRGLNKALRM